VDLINALVLGLLQGILEWLPVSSQGNLVLLAITLLRLEPSYALNFSVYLHLGTGLAALVYFRREVIRIIKRGSEDDRRLFQFLVVATLLTGLVGFPLFIFVELTSLYGEALLALTGVALLLTAWIQKDRGTLSIPLPNGLRLKNGLILGIIQGLAVIPGLSRSGVTTTALLIKGFPGKEAFRLSFLMSIPAVFAAATGLAVVKGVPPLDRGILVAISAAFISALVSIDILIKLAQRTRFWKLCILFGLIAILAVLPSFF
jgi:undecaprenyl-diphosphatase|tara:strand:+ start:5174 stop:5953 length:780 start_codon:yes stop_codon:yes gene_type:complete